MRGYELASLEDSYDVVEPEFFSVTSGVFLFSIAYFII